MDNKVQDLQAQGVLWRRYNDQLCKLAMARAGRAMPSQACEVIRIAGPDPSSGAYTCTLTFADGTKVPVDNCVVGTSWRTLFKARITPARTGDAADRLETGARRALYEAAAAYLQLRLVAYQATEEEFRRIDVAQRRSLVIRQAALEQWKNLLAVPTAQLQAYYEGGVKPAEFADLVVKALGFTAIAIGVAK